MKKKTYDKFTPKEMSDYLSCVKNLGNMIKTMENEAYRLNNLTGTSKFKGALYHVWAKLKESKMWIEDTFAYYEQKGDDLQKKEKSV